MGSAMAATVRERLKDAARGVPAVVGAAMEALHGAVAFGHGAVLLADPATFLPIAGRVEGIEQAACASIWFAEFDDRGIDRFVDVARAADPVVAFAVEPTRYAFPPDVRARIDQRMPHAFDHELRVVFRLRGTSYGFAHMLRETSFTAAEVEGVRALVAPIAGAFRDVEAHDARRGSASALAVVDQDDSIVHATARARSVLASLDSIGAVDEGRRGGLPSILLGLVSRARVADGDGSATTRVRSRDGSWLQATAARVDTPGHVAVTVEPGNARDVIRLAMASYRLTPRETEVASALARGLVDKEIAAELGISTFTARDYVKAVLAKCGVTGRGELVARLFLDHALPVLEREVVHVP